MIKKVLTPSIIAVLLWGIGLIVVIEKFYEYLRPYLSITILIAIGWMILDQIKKKKLERN
nr:hypothetical protein [uncultured Flavobacterium sp.]